MKRPDRANFKAYRTSRFYAWALFVLCAFDFQVIHAQASGENFDITRKSVVFLYRVDANGKETPDGTGFLISLPLRTKPLFGYPVLVTTRHIADPAWMGCSGEGKLVARLNRRLFDRERDATGVVEYPLENQKWITPSDDSVDIAFTLLDSALFDSLDSESALLRTGNLASPKKLENVHVGDQIVSAGLLVGVSEKRNYPVFKFGNISSIPLEKIPVPGCNKTVRLMTEWLIAANLVPGNSGSPIVFNPSINTGERPFILGVQSISFAGSDVAGMAPITYLLDALSKLHLEEVDLAIPVR